MKKNGDIGFDVKLYNDEYFAKNKAFLAQPCECPCGLPYRRYNKTAHEKGRVHKNYIRLTEISKPSDPIVDLEDIDKPGKQKLVLRKKNETIIKPEQPLTETIIKPEQPLTVRQIFEMTKTLNRVDQLKLLYDMNVHIIGNLFLTDLSLLDE